MNKKRENEGSVLLQSMVFIMIIGILAAGVLHMNLAGFLGTGNVVEAGINEAQGSAVLPQAYAALTACDGNMDGVRDSDLAANGCNGTVNYSWSYTVNRRDAPSTANCTVAVTSTWNGVSSRYDVVLNLDRNPTPCP